MRVLLACWGTFGEVRPFIWFARRLSAAGHGVTVAAPSIFAEAFKEAAAFFPLPAGFGLGGKQSEIARLFDPRWGMERLLGEVMDAAAEPQRAAFRQLIAQADAQGRPFERAFVSWIAPGAFLACREAGLPTVQCHLGPQSLFSEQEPPAFSRWPRLTGREAGTAPRPSPSRLRKALHRWGQRLTPGLTALQSAAGWPAEERGPFPLSCSWPRLAFFPQAFLEKPLLPAAHLANRWASIGGAAPEPLAEFLKEGPPPVLVVLGSVAAGDDGPLFLRIAEAVQRLGERALLLVGFTREGMERRSRSLFIAGNVWCPPLLPHVKAVVHHGGMGCLQEALAHGCPALALPHSFDQLDNALRLERLGAGLLLRPRQQDAAAIERRLGELLADKAIADEAAAWARERRLEEGLSPEETLALA